jgi:serine/threonine protein kinase/tetratricopeptide (TPR) repeat protein
MNELDGDAKEIFVEAIDQETPQALADFLDKACRGDQPLRVRVEELLRAYREAGDFLDGQPSEETIAEPGRSAGLGTIIGHYKLVERIGDGGFGVVFLAEQQQPVRRKVALKILKPGMDTPQVFGRFEAERQALALMDHPNIAKVLDAGETPSGRPYFVMELVKGLPITRYCDEHRLTVRERLVLFVSVCQAVQHAHQKGIIHRDLKPTNVLVSSADRQHVPKVIDFGVAKALGQQLTDRTLVTGFGAIIGTLEYMSPEQAEFDARDIDTRADIYSLGVLLYELLTGTTPLTKERLKQTPATEVLRLIREEDPPRPSTRMRDSIQFPPAISGRRKLEPATSIKEVRGELDWIVMKALEKDRDRRYATASALARDLEHYLNDEVVEASPPSAAYRLRKFAKRHKQVLTSLAVVAVLLVLGTAVSAWQAVRATLAERRALAERDAEETALAAEAEQRCQAEAEKRRADEEAVAANAVNEFLEKDLLGQADINNQTRSGLRNRNITVRELLDRAARTIEKKFKGQEQIQAAIRLTMGRAYLQLGEYAKALKHLERSRELHCQKFGPSHPKTLASMNALAMVYNHLNRFDEAETLFKQVLQSRRAELGVGHTDTLGSMNNLGFFYQQRQCYDQAEPLLKEAIEGWRVTLGAYHWETLSGMNNLALVYLDRGRHAEAEPILRQVVAGLRINLGSDHSRTLTALDNLGGLYLERGAYDKAEPIFRQVLAVRRANLGSDHPDTLTTLNNLGELCRERGRYQEGELLLSEAVAGSRKILGLGHSITQNAIDNLALLYIDNGKSKSAEPPLRELIGYLRNHGDVDSTAYGGQLWLLSYSLLGQEKFAEAEGFARECFAIRSRKGPELWSTPSAQSMIGGALLGQKKYAEAEPLLLHGYQGMKQREAKMPNYAKVRLTDALERLVRLYEAWDKKPEAAKWRKALEDEKTMQRK